MKTKQRWWTRPAFVLLLSVVFLAWIGGSMAHATVLTFDDVSLVPNGGHVEYNGNEDDPSGVLLGVDIKFDRILGLDTPTNSGVALNCIGCLLNFATAENTLEGPSTWLWNGPGSFTLVGGVETAGGTEIVAAGSDILTGVWSGSITGTAFGNQLIIAGFGIDAKHQSLLDFYGITTNNFVFANTNISANNLVIDPPEFAPETGAFTADVLTSDLSNYALQVALTTTVPEPSAVVLFGSGLLGFAVLRWNSRRRVK